MGRGIIGSALLAALLRPAPARAEVRGDQTRASLEDLYYDQYSERGSLYQSAPVTHVVPSLKTVTLALAADRYDVDVENYGSLKLTGYRVAPYVAVSLKRIGLGFSAETGARRIVFTDGPQTATWAHTQTSDVDYKAIGVYAYWLPFETRGEHSYTASTVVGVKDYNVTHRITPLNSPGSEDHHNDQKFRYNINEFMVGGLVEIRLLKFFSLLPWADYTYTDARDPLQQADDAQRYYQSIAAALAGDTKVLWQARPKLDFGLDLIVKAHGLALHLGEAFALLLSQQNTDQVTDKTYSVSVSLDLKGD